MSGTSSLLDGKVVIVTGGGVAHTGMPNFTRILNGASHLDGAGTLVRR